MKIFLRYMAKGLPLNGDKHGHPHMLHHTLASMALLHFKPSWDIQFLAKWLGHCDIRTTFSIYGHWIAKEPVLPENSSRPRTSSKRRSSEALQAEDVSC